MANGAAGCPLPRPKPDNNELDCERGRDVIFGGVETFFRVLPATEPEARFLLST